MSALGAGSRLGPYEILAPLGAGGMGEVWRARDTRLDRDVAIKTLPAELAQDTDRLRRFEQEARAVSALNHPNIVALYDVGTYEGSPYLVAELLEGETLRQRLGVGPLPLRRALDVAGQMAQGLAAAHDKGIAHRDLKPENVFLTEDGRVKILDFGLAKLTQPNVSGTQIAGLPTVTDATGPGVVLGTLGYMAPEQVRAQPVDHRADIFAFGAILYEMVSGRRAFLRETAADTMSAILREDPPDLSGPNSPLPPALDAVVRHCLEKEPARRAQSARDLQFELGLVAGLSSSKLEPLTAPGPRRALGGLAWLGIGALAGALLGSIAAGMFRRPESSPAQVTRFQIFPPAGDAFNIDDGPVAISPDGRHVVYRLRSTGTLQLRDFDSTTIRVLPGNCYDPFWSADSRWIGAFCDKLSKIPLDGGSPQPLAAVTDGRGASWNTEGTILYPPAPGGPLYKISADGGAPAQVTQLDTARGEVGHWRPQFLPDGRHFLYLINSTAPENSGVYVGDLDSPLKKRLALPAGATRFSPPGYLLFVDNRTLFAQPFDAGRLEMTGEPVAVARDIDTNVAYASPAFTVSQTGVLAYHEPGSSPPVRTVWIDRSGKELGTVGEPGDVNLDLSPDGKRLAVQSLDSAARDFNIWIVDLERHVRTRFTFERASELGPVWSGDGMRIAYAYYTEKGWQILSRQVDSAAPAETLLSSSSYLEPIDWSSDNRYLLYETNTGASHSDLYALPLFGDRKPIAFAATEFSESSGRFSHDGRWIAYESEESGRREIYVQPFPPTGAKWQISSAGGGDPRWRADGRELYFVSQSTLFAAPVDASGTTFRIGAPLRLFAVSQDSSVEPAPDGRRFLATIRIAGAGSPPVTVVMNWTAELGKR